MLGRVSGPEHMVLQADTPDFSAAHQEAPSPPEPVQVRFTPEENYQPSGRRRPFASRRYMRRRALIESFVSTSKPPGWSTGRTPTSL